MTLARGHVFAPFARFPLMIAAAAAASPDRQRQREKKESSAGLSR